MRVVQYRTGLAAGLASAMLLVGCGGDGKESSSPTTVPTTTTTLSQAQLDQQKAQRVNLTIVDLPGYTVDAPDPSNDNSPEFDAAFSLCVKGNPLIVRLGEDSDSSGASSPDFSKGDGAIRVSSVVTFGDTEDQARSAIADVSVATFPTCFNTATVAELKRDPSLTNVSATTTKLPALTVGDQSAGYRTVAKFRTGGTAVTVYADLTFVRSGRGVAGIFDGSAPSTFPEAERARLAGLLATRMATP